MKSGKEKKRNKQHMRKFLASDIESVTITKVVLAAIAVAGFVTVTAALPGIPLALAPFIRKQRYRDRQLYEAYRSLNRSGYVRTRRLKDGKKKVNLTKKGWERVGGMVLDAVFIDKPRRWDGKWRFVIFDIPSRFKSERNGFRIKLENLGFVLYQRSVWAYPYPCEDEVMDIAEFFEIAKHVDVITAEKIHNEGELKKLCGVR